MTRFEHHWSIVPEKQDLQETLTRELGLSPLLSRLLVNRGIVVPEAAEKFLSSTLQDLSHPFLMKDIEKATRRILEAVYHKERICIYGDFDADGVTGTAVLKLFLESVGASVSYYIPERLTEGYGLNHTALEKIRGLGTSLIVTVDCGISDREAVRLVRNRGWTLSLPTITTFRIPSLLPMPS